MGYASEFWRIRTMGKKPSSKTRLLSPECGSIALRGKFVTKNVTFTIHVDPFSSFLLKNQPPYPPRQIRLEK